MKPTIAIRLAWISIICRECVHIRSSAHPQCVGFILFCVLVVADEFNDPTKRWSFWPKVLVAYTIIDLVSNILTKFGGDS